MVCTFQRQLRLHRGYIELYRDDIGLYGLDLVTQSQGVLDVQVVAASLNRREPNIDPKIVEPL